MGTGYRNPATPWIVAGLIVVTGAWALLARSRGGVVAVVLFALALWVLALRPRLWLDARGARIRNLGSQSIEWSEVAAVGVEGHWGRYLTFHLRDGAVVRSWAVAWGGGGLLTSSWRFGQDYVRQVELDAMNLWRGGR